MKKVTPPNYLGNKILIIGCAGAGKTTLSTKLSQAIDLPIIHMDRHYWNQNWGRKTDSEWHTIVENLCQKPEWIMDGNYTKTMPIRVQHASAVIFLDTPRWQCLLRVFIRRFRFIHNKRRFDIPSHCRERLSLAFYQWVWRYPKRSRDDILSTLKSFNGQQLHLKSNTDIKRFLSTLS